MRRSQREKTRVDYTEQAVDVGEWSTERKIIHNEIEEEWDPRKTYRLRYIKKFNGSYSKKKKRKVAIPEYAEIIMKTERKETGDETWRKTVVIPAVPSPYEVCRIKPFEEQKIDPKKTKYIEHKIEESLVSETGDDFVAIYMDPPFKDRSGFQKITIEEFERTNAYKLLKHGLVFVWVESDVLSGVFDVFEKWGMRYVENICWIKKGWNNKIVKEETAVLISSKKTLLVFRKEGELDIRHQRSPDCVFDFVKQDDGKHSNEKKPEVVYSIIETMLPVETKKTGFKYLELWCRKDSGRPGWCHVYEERRK
eukprot:GHVN01004562.1.p1 GENE.GHVN01004562.1~~GHVN01004562.1.p1  ORF type:complete len:309 (+),score=43.25 GHVN01004562.1:1139-2065(+)